MRMDVKKTVAVIVDIIVVVAVQALACLIYTSTITLGWEKVGFFCEDKSIRYPFVEQTYKPTVVVAICLAFSFLSFLVTETIVHVTRRQKFRFLGLLWNIVSCQGLVMMGMVLTFLFTTLIKRLVPSARPHFLDACRLDWDSIDCSVGYVMNYTCTNPFLDEKTLLKLSTSFPSCHSAIPAVMATIMMQYYENRWTVAWSRTVKIVLQGVLLAWVGHVSMSRVTEHYHHPCDVIGGLAIGLVVGLWMLWSTGKNMECFFATKKEEEEPEKVVDEELPMRNRIYNPGLIRTLSIGA